MPIPHLRFELLESRHITDRFERPKLPKSKFLNYSLTTFFEEALDEISADVPVNGIDIVEWMHEVTADLIAMEAMATTHENNGGHITFTSGDGKIPGVKLDSRTYFRSDTGKTVASRGYAILITPYGEYKVPNPGKLTIAIRDFLLWAYAKAGRWSYQWPGGILRFDRLPILSRLSRIRDLASSIISGFSAPTFVYVNTAGFSPFESLDLSVSSSKDQTIVLTARDPGNYANKIFSTKLEVSKGTSEHKIRIISFPRVSPFVLEMQPEDGVSTVFKSMSIFP